MTRILVIDGNEAATRARHVSVGGTDSGDGYAATLKRLHPDLECDIVHPADEEPKLPAGVAIDEPIVSYGPFIMNTEAQVAEAVHRFQQGGMGHLEPLP